MIENRCLSKSIRFIAIIVFFSSTKLFSFNHLLDDRSKKIIPGAERFDKYLKSLEGKNIALVVNHSSLVNGVHLVDTLVSSGILVKKIFSPEHGFRGTADAGITIEDGKDEQTGIQVISLYGKKHKPDSTDLAGIDIMIFDIQDVGVRFYTYISTMHNIMESCAESNIPLIILDRPNPNAHYIDGPVLDTAFKSFVGMHPIPVVYGMTIGELARMIKGECWINKCERLELEIIPCKNYSHSSRVQIGVKPSPNLPNELAILLYPSLCFFEGTIVSLGRGTEFPFQVYGHPAMKVDCNFSFIPKVLPEAVNPPLKDSLCYGVDLRKLEINSVRREKKINLEYMLDAFNKLGRDSSFFLRNKFFDRLAGSDQLRIQIIEGKNPDDIRNSWKAGISKFKKRNKKYLIYRQ
jgi:uncharacterized protein YbbC (DUF1343 family)